MVCGVVQLRPFELEYAIHRAAPLACRSAVRTRASASVVIAGSHGYQNYRHHADVCHAFQILSKNGVPAERVCKRLKKKSAEICAVRQAGS